MRTSFHHQPEAQHPKSPAIYTPAGRLPHLRVADKPSPAKIQLCPLWSNNGQMRVRLDCPLSANSRHRTLGLKWKRPPTEAASSSWIRSSDQSLSEKTNVMSFTFCTGRFFIFISRCI